MRLICGLVAFAGRLLHHILHREFQIGKGSHIVGVVLADILFGARRWNHAVQWLEGFQRIRVVHARIL
jgi:hypothetical protein